MNEIKELRDKVKDLKVLFVEDEKRIREGTGLFLRKFFNNVIICNDGEEGLEMFSKVGDFDIIITDILMPKMNGAEMAKKIKEKNKDIFIVFITASRSLVHDEEELGDMFLKKPISFDDIVMTMKKVVNIK